MGSDIHTYVESRQDSGVWTRVPWPRQDVVVADDGPFETREYDVFGFLAGVRGIPALAAPRGLPDDVSAEVAEESADWGADGHTHSWLSVAELLAVDYDAPVPGRAATFRELLGPSYFRDLEVLSGIGADRPARVLFWFDN